MSEVPLGLENGSEVSKRTPIKEKVSIFSRATKEQAVIQIETTHEQLADYFEEYANFQGFDGEQAKKFLRDNVDFTFDPKEARAKYRDPDSSAIEHALSKILYRFHAGKFWGQTLTQRDGRLILCINPHAIAKKISADKRNDNSGENFQNLVNTVTNHELRHVLQFMTQPGVIQKRARQDREINRLLVGSVLGFSVSGIVPEALPYTIGVVAAMRCFLFIIQGGKRVDLEKDPKVAERMDISKLQRRPFSFIRETGVIAGKS